MSRYDEYRRQAEYCGSMAHKSNTLEARAAWLRLADKWAALANAKTHLQESEISGTTQRAASGYKDSSSTD